MNQKLEQELHLKYPELFYQKNLSVTRTSMCFGIEVGDGWFKIVDSACNLIKQHLKYKADLGFVVIREDDFYKLNIQDPAVQEKYFIIPEFTQIKEKFGELRMYVSNEDDYIRGIIDMAEITSRTTCQSCGKPSQVKNIGGWLDNVCNACIRKLDRRNARSQVINIIKQRNE